MNREQKTLFSINHVEKASHRKPALTPRHGDMSLLSQGMVLSFQIRKPLPHEENHLQAVNFRISPQNSGDSL